LRAGRASDGTDKSSAPFLRPGAGKKAYGWGKFLPLIPGGGLLRRYAPRNDRRYRRAGFTLVEVIVVLVILAILAAIAIPALTGYIDKANTSQIKAKARTAAVAMQTILSEAYADPQTRLPVSTSYSDDIGLYIDGEFITQIVQSTRDEAPGTYEIFNTESKNLFAHFHKLDASSIPSNGDDRHDTIPMRFLLFDEHFSLLAYSYFEPETYMTADMRICTYNYLLNESNDNFVYDPSAGFKVWGVADGNPVPIG
jgi:prepilin-type N-terminal cleavage/methylation domain-containing protein